MAKRRPQLLSSLRSNLFLSPLQKKLALYWARKDRERIFSFLLLRAIRLANERKVFSPANVCYSSTPGEAFD